MKKHFIVPALAVLVGLSLGVRGWGQQAGQLVPQPASQPNYPSPATPYFSPATGATTYTVYGPQQAAAQSEIAQLVKQLGEADDSTKRAEVTKQLEAAVAKSFDQDMEEREKDLTNLEDRVKKLRTQLDRRRRAKDDIIELQIKVLVNEANGLGFTSQPVRPGALPKAATRSSWVPLTTPPPPTTTRPAR